MILNNFINLIAMVFSLIGIIILIKVSLKVGGTIGDMLKIVVIGIFFSVFLHAGVELAETYELLNETVFLATMGILLTVGSGLFIVGGYIALKKLR